MKKSLNPINVIILALVKFGNGIAEIRGSIAGNTYTRNSYGSVIRQKVTPVNPNTAAQSATRSGFGTVSGLWRLLTASDQAAFNAVAPDYTRTNIFGDNVPLTGQSLFMKLSNQLTNLGLAITNAAIPPLTVSSPSFSAVEIDKSSNTIVVADLSATSATEVIGIYATSPQSGGKTFFGRSQYRLIDVLPVSSASADLDITGAYRDTFGVEPAGLTLGNKIAVFARRVSTLNGQPSVDFSSYGVVVA
jgi:hypothetical protein